MQLRVNTFSYKYTTRVSHTDKEKNIRGILYTPGISYLATVFPSESVMFFPWTWWNFTGSNLTGSAPAEIFVNYTLDFFH